jgi:hypothetical protein
MYEKRLGKGKKMDYVSTATIFQRVRSDGGLGRAVVSPNSVDGIVLVPLRVQLAYSQHGSYVAIKQPTSKDGHPHTVKDPNPDSYQPTYGIGKIPLLTVL